MTIPVPPKQEHEVKAYREAYDRADPFAKIMKAPCGCEFVRDRTVAFGHPDYLEDKCALVAPGRTELLTEIRKQLRDELGYEIQDEEKIFTLSKGGFANTDATHLEYLLWDKLVAALFELKVKKMNDHYENCRTDNCKICKGEK
jgi:hypothetical protein